MEPDTKRLDRACGILLHPTSLPGRYGIGDLGPEADRFVEFLAKTGQRWWQFLPLGPTGYGNSPYQPLSSQAGNPLLISPELLQADGLATAADLESYPKDLPEDHVDFDAVRDAKNILLRRVYENFQKQPPHGLLDELDRFKRNNLGWLRDYALFLAIREQRRQIAWSDWPETLARREKTALDAERVNLAEEIEYVEFVQFVFDRQWRRLRELCRQKRVGLIGDVPIYTADDSADVWLRPELFRLNEHGKMTVQAAVPPDYFNPVKGQLWGNPLYDWQAHAAEGYSWWTDRLQATLDRVDLVRLDHFRGFEKYWEVAADERQTAAPGRWKKGPGAAFLAEIRAARGGDLRLIAEDLGFITPPVRALRDQFGLPGMKILQFSFGPDPGDLAERPFNYPRHCLVYTGTHDNDTIVGWFQSLKPNEQKVVTDYLGGTHGQPIHWEMIRLALSTAADTAIIPMQDLLGLGNEARMNYPGDETGVWWRWRYCAEQLTDDVSTNLAKLTRTYGR